MKVVYASRTGNVQRMIERMGLEATKIETGEETVEGDYLLITYTDGKGIIPPVVVKFSEKNKSGLKAAAVSGNKVRHPDEFCAAADKLEEKYGCRILARFHKQGGAITDEKVRKFLAESE